jgi:chemotaxis signal transduction protein
LASTRSPDAESGDDGSERPRALVALLGHLPVALPAELVQSVVRPGPVTPVPGAAGWLLGVTAVRGRVLAVGDLAALAGAAPGAAGRGGEPGDGWFVVVDDGARAAALAGLRVRRVAAYTPAADADAIDRAARVPAGLPARGLVRLAGDTARGAASLPQTAALLDVAALLDLVHDSSTDGG